MADLGSDISGVTDVDATLSVVTGNPSLAQAILRRLGTPRGGLLGKPTYGYDIAALIGSSVPVSVIEQRILEQVQAEEEVESVRAQVLFDASRGVLTVQLDIIASDGPFELTITQTALTVEALLDGVELPLAA